MAYDSVCDGESCRRADRHNRRHPGRAAYTKAWCNVARVTGGGAEPRSREEQRVELGHNPVIEGRKLLQALRARFLQLLEKEHLVAWVELFKELS